MTNNKLIIGIAGGTGSGKTTVVQKIMRNLKTENVLVISQDNYYRDHPNLSFDERVKINFDHPRSIDFELLTEHLKILREGGTVEQPVYSFITHNRTNETILTHSKDVIILEGILVLTYPELRDLLDLKIYVHADSDERLIRRIQRDIQERGRDLHEVLNRYRTTLKPMHEQFIEPSKNHADIIIPNMKKQNDPAIRVIATLIKDKLNPMTAL